MKALLNPIKLFAVLLGISGALGLYSCEDEALENGGEPVVYYIRNTAANKSDSLYIGAPLGNLVAIIGDNLGATTKIMFNDQEAELNTNYITSKTILVNIPADAPITRNDLMVLTFKDGSTYQYPFQVDISPPIVASMENEWVKEGETAVIRGNYFFEPLTVKLPDGNAATLASVSQTELTFVMPAGIPEGPFVVTTNFGETTSAFNYHDTRNTLLNYDNLTTTESWRRGLITADENSLDKNFVKFKGTYNQGERNEGAGGDGSTFESQFFAMKSGREEHNYLPGEPSDYSLKFECKVIGWDKSYLNICWAPWDYADNNQEIWDNKLNARAIWGPWDKDKKEYNTDGKWITVEVPMTEFKWAMGVTNNDVTYTELKFDKKVTGSLSFWVLAATGAADSPFEFYIDNVRVVPNKIIEE